MSNIKTSPEVRTIGELSVDTSNQLSMLDTTFLKKLVHVRTIDNGGINDDSRNATVQAFLDANLFTNWYFCFSTKIPVSGELLVKLERKYVVVKRGTFVECLAYVQKHYSILIGKRDFTYFFSMSDKTWNKKSLSNSQKNNQVQTFDNEF